jgi:hypothetical protein
MARTVKPHFIARLSRIPVPDKQKMARSTSPAYAIKQKNKRPQKGWNGINFLPTHHVIRANKR